MLYSIVGRFDRHRRVFDVYAATEDEARYQAEVLIRAVYSRGSGTYGPLVWTYGEVTMTSFDGEEVVLQTQRPILRLIEGGRQP